MPGTYLNSFFESRPLPYAEGGFGFPDEGQTLVNVPNGKLIRLLVDDEPLDVRYGQVHAHERTLDMRSGILTRHVEWTSPNGQRVEVTSQRLVSFSQRAVAAISYEVSIPEDAGLGRAARRPVRALRQRADAPDRGRPAGGRGAHRPAGARAPLALPLRRADDPPDAALRAARRRRHGAPGLRPRRRVRRELLLEQRRAHHRDLPPQARAVATPGQVPRLRLVELPLPARDRRPGRGRPRRLALHRLGRPGGRAARVPRRLLGPGRRRDRRRPAPAAGHPLLPLPRAAGGRAGREARHRGEGADRAGLRRPQPVGHRDVRAARVHVHPAPRRGRRAALAALDARRSPRPTPSTSA